MQHALRHTSLVRLRVAQTLNPTGCVPGVGGHAHGSAAEGRDGGDAKCNDAAGARAKSGLRKALACLGAGAE